MRRSLIHYLVDVVLLLSVLTLVATGLLIYFVLPPGRGGDSVWSLTRHDWGEVHFWTSMVMLAAVVVHLAVNWTWVCTVTVRLFDRSGTKPSALKRNTSGVIVLGVIVAVIAGFLLVASASKEVAERGEGWRHVDGPTGGEGRGTGGGWRGGR